jgi:hypothetical protein
MLTLGTNGINMSGASQNLTISSGLIIPAPQRWNVTNGMTLTVSGTVTRSGNATLITGASTAVASQGNVTFSPTLENGVVPWAAAQSSGAATNASATGYTFATVTGGNLVAYTNATLENTAGTGVSFGGIPNGDNSTVNYDLNVASTGGDLTNDIYVNTLRNIGGAYTQSGTNNFRTNAIMNAGTNVLTINTPIQQADTTLNELVLSAQTAGITIKGLISNNVNPLKVTFTGASSSQSILISNYNTFSGGAFINSVRVGISNNSVPASGTVTNGPLGTGTITLNGGILFAGLGGFAIGNPIFVGPGGGQLQVSGASPDLTINGNVTGSGPLYLAGVYNQNGLFLNGDNSAFNGTVIVSGSHTRRQLDCVVGDYQSSHNCHGSSMIFIALPRLKARNGGWPGQGFNRSGERLQSIP